MTRWPLAALLLVPSLAAAAADRVTVKGAVLEGKVRSISAKHVVMETIYGKGDLRIATEDVTAIETDAPFHVYKADDGKVVGPVVGVSPAAITVAAESGTTEVPFEQVQAAPREAGPKANWFSRRAVESPWWKSHYDFALSATESTIDSSALAVGFGAQRERGPSRLEFGATYLRGTSQDDDTENLGLPDNPDTPEDESQLTEDGREEVTKNEVRGFVRQEYDLTKRIFALGSLEAEHDGVESLAYRLIPKVGAGFKIVDREDTYIAVDAGVAYVYERFYDDSLNNYLSLAFGAGSKLKLPWLGASWVTRADYYPSITDWSNDYRVRGETALVIPIVEQLSLRASLIDEYTAQPADDTLSNTLTTLLGLSLTY
jgi:hypothetical protein